MARSWLRWTVSSTVLVLMASCGDGGDDGGATTSTTFAPDIDVVASLIEPETLGEGWSITAPPDEGDGADGMFDGTVRTDQQQLLPRPELCDRASDDARQAIDNIVWKAFRQLELAVDDPLGPPLDRTGHLVFLHQLMTTGTADDLQATMALLREGFDACLGDIPAGEEDPAHVEPWFTTDALDELVTVVTARL
jgi:hypothetical protein